ncbi:MAG TPA: YXWGXW repeat-containing protein [Candidatus Sulfotelmatobacter sp.]|nr:YXWGXW repeat-containing protein [Candidatus Sulfotelmatobacter sp.]
MRNRSIILSLLLAILLLVMAGTAAGQVRVGVAIAIAPPPIPVYEQPICPGDGYIWTPGYWAYDYDDADYYWVPGTWVPAPEVGFLWTPGYWAWGGDGFVFTAGYWGPVVGFYGGINYGFGYFGHGYEGGRWDGGHFYYNTTVNRVNVEVIHNVYNTRVTETTASRVSYNGGKGGINVRPTSQEEAAAQQRHISPVGTQMQHEQAARADKQQRASVNHGAPAVAATPKPGAFQESGVVRTREAGGTYNPAPRSENNASRNDASKPVVHPADIPRVDRPAPPNTGNPKQDLKYQQQQEKLQAKQQQEMQKLQQKQEQEHQQVAKQQANQAKQQQMEQRHQQQTQQLQQKHSQQTEQMHQRQQAPAPPHPSEGKPHG